MKVKDFEEFKKELKSGEGLEGITASLIRRKAVDHLVSLVKFQEPKKETVKTDSTASNTYYRVVAGSYTNRANADKLVTELKNKGYSAFIDIYKK